MLGFVDRESSHILLFLLLLLTQSFESLATNEQNKHPFGQILLGQKDWGTPGATGWIDVTEPTSPTTPHHYMNRDDDHINHYDMHLHVPLHFAISSFRDQLCPITLFNLFTKSSNPNRIYVRVLQQNDEDDVDCFTEYCNLIKLDPAYYAYSDCPFENSIEVMTIPSSAAKGPTYARALVSEMIRMAFVDEHLDPQDFCLQTDSHMDFVQNFDSELIKDWLLANNEYAILSTYVAPTSDLLNPSFPTKHEVPHLCMVQFTSNVRNWGTKACKDLVRPKLTNAVWGAGLSFSKVSEWSGGGVEKDEKYEPQRN